MLPCVRAPTPQRAALHNAVRCRTVRRIRRAGLIHLMSCWPRRHLFSHVPWMRLRSRRQQRSLPLRTHPTPVTGRAFCPTAPTTRPTRGKKKAAKTIDSVGPTGKIGFQEETKNNATAAATAAATSSTTTAAASASEPLAVNPTTPQGDAAGTPTQAPAPTTPA